MTFLHEDREFGKLLRIVAEDRKIAAGLVEKDYWVVHTLWALHQGDFQVWFKGGTSLSKGFSLIPRMSEDLDLRIDSQAAGFASVLSWHSEKDPQISARATYFQSLTSLIVVPGASVDLMAIEERKARKADYRVDYPGQFKEHVLHPNSPFVKLEIGTARVTPFAAKDLASFVHEHVERIGGLAAYEDNRPRGVKCIHPLVTLIEKLDALARHVPSEREPAAFVRHYEDAARIIQAESQLPALGDYEGVNSLAEEMLSKNQIRALPDATHSAFALPPCKRTDAIRAANEAIAPMFWAPRIPFDEACQQIRDWISFHF